ncbi:MAG TPA: DUF664 domain-containing protein [Galbitalea sp.]|jgi:uncharacterized damage-inducible protein DinB|nr:DUF664 domain-containing protein [Galbitalea sp.]
MTTATDVLIDSINRVKETATRAVNGLSQEQLEARIDPQSNTIAWLLWHLARGQDLQVSDLDGGAGVWTADGWKDRFALPFADRESGYGHSAEDVAQVRGVSPELLAGYLVAVCDRTVEYLGALTDDDLGRIVDTRWNPPVTLAARIVSIVSDNLQHTGQAALLRGILERTGV